MKLGKQFIRNSLLPNYDLTRAFCQLKWPMHLAIHHLLAKHIAWNRQHIAPPVFFTNGMSSIFIRKSENNFLFWHLCYCSLSSAIFLEEIAFRFLMDPHLTRSSLSPLLSEIPTKIIRLEGMALPTERIEGNDANKTSKQTNKKLNKCLLCRCGHNVDDDVYGSSLSHSIFSPFLKGSFLSTT